MSNKSAFPWGNREVGGEPGMTFREWQWTQFMVAALQGYIAMQPAMEVDLSDSEVQTMISKSAIDQADTMMAEIEKREQDK